ncbi:MAG: hypothetical protein PHW46_04015 [Candidatus Omnitrophica bacterium]|nr:hypothetical protein [Candidatus Omnitrophota bacterium]
MRAVYVIAGGMVKELIRKKDFYVLFILMLALLGFLSSQSFFQIEGISRYIRDFGYSMVVIFSFLITVMTAAKQLPSEIESKTIYPLLAKPINRKTIILGKYFGSVFVSILAFTALYAMYLVFYMATGEKKVLSLLAEGYLMGGLFLSLVAALVIFFSTFLTMSANVAISILLYFMINGFSQELRNLSYLSKGAASYVAGAIFYVIPHFDFYDMRVRLTHSWDALPAWIILAVSAYTIVYAYFLLHISGMIFGKKKL